MPAAHSRPNTTDRERVTITLDHGSTAATLSPKMWKIPAGRSLLIERVSYINPTGLAQDGSNFFVGTIKDGATVVATIFDTSAGAITADTFIEGVPSATVANRWLAAADILQLVLTKTGTQTLPAGRVVIEGFLY